MIKRRNFRASCESGASTPVIEPLEDRRLLSASGFAAAAKKTKTPPASNFTTVNLHVSRHLLNLGTSLVVTATVTGEKGEPAPTGTVDIDNFGVPIASDSGTLNLTLIPIVSKNKNAAPKSYAQYDFTVGNVALLSSSYTLSAEYLGDSKHAGSTSSDRNVVIETPTLQKIDTKDDLQAAALVTGHGPEVKLGDTVYISYTGMLQSDGTVFDFSNNHTPTFLSATVGAGQLIPGFDEGLRGMRVGETRVLFIPSAIGYGTAGSGQNIPANANLVFLVKLLNFTKPAKT